MSLLADSPPRGFALGNESGAAFSRAFKRQVRQIPLHLAQTIRMRRPAPMCPLQRELQGNGQVNRGPVSAMPSSAGGLFYGSAVLDQLSPPLDANQEFSAGFDPGVLRRGVDLLGCCRAESALAK